MGSSASQPTSFSLLPEARKPWAEFFLTTGGQICVVVLLAWVRALHPGTAPAPEHTHRSIPLVSTPVQVNLRPQPAHQRPRPIFDAKVEPETNPLRLHTPQPQSRFSIRTEATAAPAFKLAAGNLQPLPLSSTPVAPRIVATNVFGSGSSAEPSTTRAAKQVQTGGFGDPHGIPTRANSGEPINVAASGSFDLPLGPGRGNGTGGSNGSRGVVASSGFGNGTAAVASSANSSQAIQSTGFGDAATPIPASAKSRIVEVSPIPVLPAEILSKPNPVYTQEARTLQIEGEVLVEVLLEASGQSHVVRVVRGLGHGLDDNAVKAVEQIRFKPATRNGQAADSTVVMHIIFHLA